MSKHESLLDVLHGTAKGLRAAGTMDDATMREFDALCLTPLQSYSASEIKNLRLRFKASQAVFAAYLNTSISTVRKWEQGQMRPSGTSLKLLNLADRKGLDILA